MKRTTILKVDQQQNKKTSQGQSNQQSKKNISYLALNFFTQQVPHGGVSHSRGDSKVIETFHKKIYTKTR